MGWKFNDLRIGVEALIGDRVPARILAFVYQAFVVEFSLESSLSGPRLTTLSRLTQMSCTD